MPKKRRVSPLVPSSESDPAHAGPAEPEPEPEPDPEPAPELPPLPLEDPEPPAPPQQSPAGGSSLELRLWAAKVKLQDAKKDVKKFEKKWEKVRQTYVESGKYSRYDPPSVVQRVEGRLLKADGDLANARLTLGSPCSARTRCG